MGLNDPWLSIVQDQQISAESSTPPQNTHRSIYGFSESIDPSQQILSLLKIPITIEDIRSINTGSWAPPLPLAVSHFRVTTLATFLFQLIYLIDSQSLHG